MKRDNNNGGVKVRRAKNGYTHNTIGSRDDQPLKVIETLSLTRTVRDCTSTVRGSKSISRMGGVGDDISTSTGSSAGSSTGISSGLGEAMFVKVLPKIIFLSSFSRRSSVGTSSNGYSAV